MIALFPILKGAAGIATSLGAGAVVGNAIKATTPENMKIGQKVLVGVGGVVLSSIAGDVAARYVELQMQAVADGVRLAKDISSKVGHAAGEAADTFAEEVNKDDVPPAAPTTKKTNNNTKKTDGDKPSE